MGNKNIWSFIKDYFSPYEDWGDYEKMNHGLLYVLYELRKIINKPFIIHAGYGSKGHAPNSYHNRGGTSCAVDFHIKNFEKKDLIDIIIALKDMNVLYGLGFYPFSNTKFIHLDLRGKHIYWHKNKKGKYEYYTNFSEFYDNMNKIERGEL